jgi:hypothetical protein
MEGKDIDTPQTETVLNRIVDILDTYIAFPDDESRDASALWTMHTWVYHSFENTPRLSVSSSEPASGKTRVLEVIREMCPNPMLAVSMTPSTVYRSIKKYSMLALLFDEVDTIFGRSGSSSSHRDLQGILNSGYRRGAVVPRAVGTDDVENFPTFAPVAMSGLGHLPDALGTRAIHIKMKRASGTRSIKPLRMRFAEPVFNRLRVELGKWALEYAEALSMSLPAMPDGVVDRNADIWEPLIAIADLAGADWSERARKACVHLIGVSSKKDEPYPVKLLSRIREIYEEDSLDQMFTTDLLEKLGPDWGLNPKSLSRVMSEYDVPVDRIRIDNKQGRGYRKDDIAVAWKVLGIHPKKKEDPDEFKVTSDGA